MAGEMAIKERAKRESINLKSQSANTLVKLLRIVLQRRWSLDANFEVTARAAPSDTAGEQDYAQRLADAFRRLRNELAHGGVFLDPSPGWAFTAVRDLINQLFPANVARVCRRD